MMMGKICTRKEAVRFFHVFWSIGVTRKAGCSAMYKMTMMNMRLITQSSWLGRAHLPHPVPVTMYNVIIVSISGDGKEDALNIEDDDEQSADNSIKLTRKTHLRHSVPVTMYNVITYLYSRWWWEHVANKSIKLTWKVHPPNNTKQCVMLSLSSF